MPKGKLVKSLLKAYSENDHQAVKKIANKIIKDEKQKSHHNLAHSLEEIVASFNGEEKDNNLMNSSYFNRLPRDEQSGADLISIIKPSYYLQEVILSEQNNKIIKDLLKEHYNINDLKSFGLDAKRRLLFCGPPGCGKTMTAHALANEIGLPLLYVHMDSLVSSYLGDTASNLREIFKYAEKGRWVIFFDEFDTIGKSREDEHEHGELKRAVNTLLQMLDNVKIKSLFIAATNHQHLLDHAAWRRFEEIIYFEKPNQKQIANLIKMKLKTFNYSKAVLTDCIKDMIGFSHAQVEQVCHDAIKESIINDYNKVNTKTFQKSLQKEKRRQNVYNKNIEGER